MTNICTVSIPNHFVLPDIVAEKTLIPFVEATIPGTDGIRIPANTTVKSEYGLPKRRTNI